ncbi:MAG: CDP-diacylglycerol--glycerol-3-phosphate 3-phosphatidyltransferase [Pseudomonadota bacterium]|nr:CDP-diacylglycerol--glycerol-3-phosphate 3-phosphatidyltransferase [Pseudomonadota bacterium]
MRHKPLFWNIPNSLTLLRILLIPVLVAVFFSPFEWSRQAASMIFLVAAITDWFDGYLARKLDQLTPFGAFLDPVADKLMVASALVLLVSSDPQIAVTISAIIIVGREITISSLREWMAELGARATVAVSMLGKLKTVAQMTAITVLLWRDPIAGLPLYEIGLILLYIAAAMTLWSMIVYLRAAWPILTSRQ